MNARSSFLCRCAWLSIGLLLGLPWALPGAPSARLDLHFEAEEGLESTALELALRPDDRSLQLARFVGLEDPGTPVAVHLLTEAHPVARQTPHWISGFALVERDTVVLFPARVPIYPHDSMQELLDHELLHILLHRSVPGRPIPRWFSEGVALVGSRGLSLADRGQALVGGVRGGPRTVAALERSFANGRRGSHTAYALSGAFVHHLTRRHGPGFLAELTRAMRTGATFEVALELALGEPLGEAEERFFRRSRLLYSWLPWLSSGAGLWLLVTGLALVAGRRTRRRTAAIEARWAAEEIRREEMRRESLLYRIESESPPSPGPAAGDEEPEEWIH